MDKRTPNCCYAVARGRSVGVFKTWKECESQVKGFKNARYKKFQSEAEALEFIRQVNSSCPGYFDVLLYYCHFS
ncbi:hypothetical protein AB6A40_004761 [Gnathostoma spinigerum]|uniref:ribonuclease H n=1 Tax=Gnathostoma spinigerum TaxID=75299 RepID=A0ABD6ENC0_9BILA